VSRLFKTRYFSTSDFFGAKIGTSLSYAWLSVEDVVKRGVRWSIGTSNSIPLMDQPWLASSVNISAIHTSNAKFHSICVSELINQISKSWKEPPAYTCLTSTSPLKS